MALTEENPWPDAVEPLERAVSEHMAERDLASESFDQPLEVQTEEASPGAVSRSFHEATPEHPVPEVAPQDPSVPDVLVPPPAVASLVNPSITGPSASQPRKWLALDGKAGARQHETGSSRPRFWERNAISWPSDSHEEALLKAARFGLKDIVAFLLLDKKAGTEFIEEERGRTPLLCAAEGNSAVIVQMLLEYRAKWDVTDNAKRTALHLASLNGRDEIVQVLLQRTKIGVDEKDDQGATALHLAARSGNEFAIQHLLDRGASVQTKDKKGVTPLHLAAKKGLAAVETLLFIAETTLDDRSSNDRTPLMQACDRPTSDESEAIVTLLLNNGADPSARDNNGETPLSLAASSGNTPVVEILIDCSVNVNTLNMDGNSALFGPAKFDHDETAKVLLDSGINSRVVNNDPPPGRTALLETAKYDTVKVTFLILENWAADGIEHQDLLQSALFEAALYDSSRVAQLLIEKGARINARGTRSNKTPIEVANLHGSTKVVALLLEKGGQLFSQGPSLGAHMPDAPSEADSTPLIPVDSHIDLGFGFKSTIVSFFFDDHENSTMVRPPVQSVLYDHSPETIKTGLEAAAGMDASSKNFRWLHIPGNNPVWVNSLITRMYKDCKPPEKSAYFQKKCKHLFGEEIWSRHQYQMSATSVAHRRFIRPICQQIPMNQTDTDNMMMVLPYFHWETTKGREKMRDVIIEAMKSYIGDVSPLATTKLKGLGQALKELESARDPDYYDGEEVLDSESGSVSSSYYTDSSAYESSVRRTRKTRQSRGESENPDQPVLTDLTDTWVVPRNAEASNIRKARATAIKPEEERRKRRRIEKIVDIAKTDRSPDDKLILSYMFHEPAPMHFRRTLDQYYYYTLPTTEARDKDQVITRYFEKTWPDDDNLLLMVDQLWLWILDSDTVVTSFPQRWNKTGKPGDCDPDPSNASDIVESIIRYVARTDRRPLKSAFDLAELIASKCIGTMFEHLDIANEKLRFSEFFEISIGNVTNEESKMFDQFTDLSEQLATGDHRTADLDMLFNISKETKLIKEIKDIRDELHIISTVLYDQERVLVDMETTIRAIKEGKITKPAELKKTAEASRQTPQSYHSLVESVRRHIETVKGLDKQAEKTYLSLNDLLDLKQKQANVSEARSQRQQAQETARQGQTLMLFTVITVFFLPLSFLTTFFQLDIADFVRNGQGQLGLAYVSEITFPITSVVVAVSLFLAFRFNPITLIKRISSSTWRMLKIIAALALLAAILPVILVYVFTCSGRRKRRPERDTIVVEERYNRHGRSMRPEERYSRQPSGHRVPPRSNSSLAAITGSIASLRILLGLRRNPRARSRQDGIRVVEEGRWRRARSGGERYIGGERSRSRPRRGAPTSPLPPRRAWFQADNGDDVVVIEEHSPVRRTRARRDSFVRSTPTRFWNTIVGTDNRRTRAKGRVVREGYWYGSRPQSRQRRKWPPWAWFKQEPVPVRRRTREIYVSREERPPGLWRRVGRLLITTALCFGLFRPTQLRSRSRTSSPAYGSGSTRSSGTRDERAAPIKLGFWKKVAVWLAALPTRFLGLFRGQSPHGRSPSIVTYRRGSTSAMSGRRRRRSSSPGRDGGGRPRRRSQVLTERRSSRRR